MSRESIRFDGQAAIVTGAGSGLGRAYACELARRGAGVVVCDNGANTPGGWRADDTVAEIEAAGGRAVASTASVLDRAGCRRPDRAGDRRFGRLDMLVNNAGVFRYKPFDRVSLDEFDDVVDVNFTGSVNVTQPAFAVMARQGYGRILFTTSTSGLLGMAGYSAYASAKMGLVGLAHVLAEEGRERNILCNLIAPIARTGMTERIIGAIGPAPIRSMQCRWRCICYRPGARSRTNLQHGRWQVRAHVRRANAGLDRTRGRTGVGGGYCGPARPDPLDRGLLRPRSRGIRDGVACATAGRGNGSNVGLFADRTSRADAGRPRRRTRRAAARLPPAATGLSA